MPATVSTYSTLRVDQSFNFNNFSQDSLVNTRPVSQLRPFLANNGRASYRLSNQSRTSSTYSTSSGPLTPRNQNESPDFATAPSIASSELEPHAITEEPTNMYSAPPKMATPVMHPRFNRMSMWVPEPEGTVAQEEPPTELKTPSSTTSSLPSLQTVSDQLLEEAEEGDELSEEIVESPQIYHVLELENDLIEDMVSLKLAKPIKSHRAETAVFTRPKTLMIPPSPVMKKPIPIPIPIAKPRPRLSSIVTAPVVSVSKPSPKPCPVHGNKHKSTIITPSLPSSPIIGSQQPLPSPIAPSKLRNSQAVDSMNSMRKSLADSIKSFDEIRKSKHFSTVPKSDQVTKIENRKSYARRKFSFEHAPEEPTPAVPANISTPVKTVPERGLIKPVTEVGSPKITNIKPEIPVEKPLSVPARTQTAPMIMLASEKSTDKSNRDSFESFKLDLTLTLPTNDKPLPSPTKAPCPVHGHAGRPNSTWTTKPPVIVPPRMTLPPRTSSISSTTLKELKEIEAKEVKEIPLTSPDLASPSLQFLQEDPFNSRLSIELQQKTRPKSSGGDGSLDGDDPILNRPASSKAPSVRSTRSTRSMKNGLSKMKSIFTPRRTKTMDIQGV